MNPSVSVIVPVYSVEKYLNRCVESIVSQTYENLEIILVDDGSPDNCPAMCDEWAKKDNRIKVVHKQNGGVSSARNEGIKVALGEWMWFVDSDDYILENALENLSGVLSDNFDLIVFNKNTDSVFSGDFNTLLTEHYFKYHFGFECWNKIYNAQIVKKRKLFFDTEETIGEDLLYNIKYYRYVNRIRFLNDNYYFYDDRLDSAMNTHSKKRLIQQLRLFDKIKAFYNGEISADNLTYLFLLHLISGIGQAKSGGLLSGEFAVIMGERNYQKEIINLKTITSRFFENEHASILGKVKISRFISLLKTQKYENAAKIMGLK